MSPSVFFSFAKSEKEFTVAARLKSRTPDKLHLLQAEKVHEALHNIENGAAAGVDEIYCFKSEKGSNFLFHYDILTSAKVPWNPTNLMMVPKVTAPLRL